jgi:hypothetical protein
MEVWPDEWAPVDEADLLAVSPGECHECGTPIRISVRRLNEWAALPIPTIRGGGGPPLLVRDVDRIL